MSIPVTEKQLSKLKITNDQNEVHIGFRNLITESDEAEDPESSTLANEYTIKAKHRPHKDLVDCMKKLRKFALEACEIEVDSKKLTDWNVSTISITGDVVLRKSRVVMTLTKKVNRTGKFIEFKTPQVTMYPEKDEEGRFANAEKMSEQIEEIIEEGWSYMNGKFEMEINPQLALFKTDNSLQEV
jgi:hypothetical protein